MDTTAEGLCKCGCGQTTPTWKRTQRTLGRIKGEHANFINGHDRRTRRVVDGKLHCSDCDTWKPLDEFHTIPVSSGGHLGKAHYCKPCQGVRARWSAIRISYGITREQYDELLEKQSGVCAICHTPPGQKPLVVDHCHHGNGIRGLLCNNCNVGIGRLRDDPLLVRRALEYLERE